MNFERCSHCGEERHDIRWVPGDWHQSQSGHWEAVPGQPDHDSKRCWTIAHARAADMRMNGLVPTEADHNIAELARWLQDHPAKPHWTADQRRARADRERALKYWLNRSQDAIRARLGEGGAR